MNDENRIRAMEKKFLTVCIAGLILLAGGMVLGIGSYLLKDGSWQYSHYEYGHTDESLLARTAGLILAFLGMVTLIVGLLWAFFLSETSERQTRMALLGSATGLLFILFVIGIIISVS